MKSHACLGLDMYRVLNDSTIVEINGIKICVPSSLDQIIMKYTLWRSRGEGKTEGQKDADDIKKLVAFYYKNVENLFSARRKKDRKEMQG